MEYFYVDIHNNAQGPFGRAELMEIINEDTIVWREGIDWTIAKKIKELKKLFNKVPESKKTSVYNDEEILKCLNKIKNQWAQNNSLYIKGNIDYKKHNNLACNISSVNSSIEDCLIYYDNTLFGKGDNGFILNKNYFAWKNNDFEIGEFMYINENTFGFEPAAELIKFNVGTTESIVAVNQASINIINGGHTVNIHQLKKPNLFIEPLNELLKLLK